jgi:tRNA pseudouridine55 synthase
MNGVLVIDKPVGPTSHDVVAVVRRAVQIDRIGHTGTLDPLATGVLPLVVGRATRLASFLSGVEKEYEARVKFGASTATYDAEGEVIPVPLPGTVDAQVVQKTLPDFVGTYWQMPPPFSAKKVDGTPAYKLARRHKPVELKPVEVTVRHIELRGFAKDVADVHLVCSSGFYVRSLAHDLGERLECGAYLEGLRRTRAGSFSLSDAAPLEAIIQEGPLAVSRLIPIDRLLPDLPAVVLSEQGVRRATHGNALGRADVLEIPTRISGRLRLLDGAGTLLGIAESIEGGLLHPVVVLV